MIKYSILICALIISVLSFSLSSSLQYSDGTQPHLQSSSNLLSFLKLSDTPKSYSGNANNCVLVNAGETGLGFGSCGTPSSNSTFNATYDATTQDVNANRSNWFSIYNVSYYLKSNPNNYFNISNNTVSNGFTGATSFTNTNALIMSGGTTTTALTSLQNSLTTGTFVRITGLANPVGWSTLVLPNAATKNYIVYASGTNIWGESKGLQFDGTTFTTDSATIQNVTVQGLLKVPYYTTSPTCNSNSNLSVIRNNTGIYCCFNNAWARLGSGAC